MFYLFANTSADRFSLISARTALGLSLMVFTFSAAFSHPKASFSCCTWPLVLAAEGFLYQFEIKWFAHKISQND